jgi:hypothetical protein
MNTNPYRALLALLPDPPEDVGEVVAITGDGVTLETLSGATVTARGAGWSLGDLVYVKDGTVQGPAPVIATVEIEV